MSRVDRDNTENKKTARDFGVILLSEYHASSIRLWQVILLRSDIRLAPSGIRFASFRANRIPLKPQGFNITIAVAIISLFAKAKNITKKAEKERELHGILLPKHSLFCFYCKFRICFTNASGCAHTPILFLR